MAAFAAISISGSTLTVVPEAVDAFVPSSTTMVAEKVIREGIYREYEVDVQPQQYDDARSTFKPAKETKSKKGKQMDLCQSTIKKLTLGVSSFCSREIHCTSRHSHCWYDATKLQLVLANNLLGSFIIPMAQYFWYVRDDDSSDQFFGQNVPEPEEKPKKKWF